jgi:prefoldin subunit 5
MSSKLRKVGPALAALVLIVSGTTAGISSAQAATIKQGVKCSPAKAVKTVSGVKYTCTTNPAGTPAGLTWTLSTCFDADKAYKSTKAQYDDFVTSQTSTLAAIKASIDASKHSIDVLNQGIAAAQTKKYIVGYDHTVKPTAPITVVGIDAAIAAINAKISADTAKRDAAGKQRDALKLTLAAKYTATQIAGWEASTSTTSGNADVNVQNFGLWIRAYSSYDSAISNAQKNIANLQKVPANFQSKLTKAQEQVDSMTTRYNAAIASQPAQAQTIKSASDQALLVRKAACKAGL